MHNLIAPSRTDDELLSAPLEIYHSLKSSLQLLCDSLEGAAGVVWHLPLVRDSRSSLAGMYTGSMTTEERKLARKKAEGALWDAPVPVKRLEGRQALRRAAAALRKLERRENQPPDRPDRLAGLIYGVPVAARRRVAVAVAEVNANKRAFKAAVMGLPWDVKERRLKLAGTELRHVLLLQAYREIELVEGEILAASFGWSGGSHSVGTVPRAELVNYLQVRGWRNDEESEGLVDEVDSAGWEQRLASAEGEFFLRVRRMAPFPVVNLELPPLPGSGKKNRRRVAANLPLIALDMDQMPAALQGLVDYDPKKQRPRSTVKTGEVLFPGGGGSVYCAYKKGEGPSAAAVQRLGKRRVRRFRRDWKPLES